MSDVADPLSSFAPEGTGRTPQSNVTSAKARVRRNSGALEATGHGIITSILFLLVFLPPAIMAAASIWAVVTGVRSLWEGVQLFKSWQIGSVGSLLPSLDAASRLALFGVSFFAVLFGLIVFMGGTFGRGWRHLFLVPAVILTAPSLVIFVQSSRMTGELLTQYGVPQLAQLLLFTYLVLDAAVLALILTDISPRRRRAKAQRRRARDMHARTRRTRDGKPLEKQNVADLPYVPFDLSNPFEETASTAVVQSEPHETPQEAPQQTPSKVMV